MRNPRLFASSFIAAFLAVSCADGFARDTGLIFVGSELTDSLIIIDPETSAIVKHLKTSRRPRDMRFNADHSKLYVASGDDYTIDVVDVAKLEIVGRLATTSGPAAIAIDDRRGRIYAVNPEGSTLSVIDIAQNTIVHDIPTGAGPDGVLLSEDGRFAYVTTEIGDLVHLVDAVSGNVVQSAQVGTRPRRFAATPNGRELWVSAELSGEVYIIDRTEFAVAGKIEFRPPGALKTDVTPGDILIARDGRTAYVTLGYAAHVAVVDLPTRQVAGYIPTKGRTSRLAITRDERTLYAAGSSGDLTVIDVKGRKATGLIEVGSSPCCVLVDD